SSGGRESETTCLLCMPISTSNSATMMRKTVLKSSFALIIHDGVGVWWRPSSPSSASFQCFLDQIQQFHICLDCLKLGKLHLNGRWRTEKEGHVRRHQHGGVIEGIAGRDNVVVQVSQGDH